MSVCADILVVHIGTHVRCFMGATVMTCLRLLLLLRSLTHKKKKKKEKQKKTLLAGSHLLNC